MSANGMWTSRYEHESGYGDTLFTWGVINVVDGEVYFDSIPLRQYFKNFEGKVAAMEVVFGLKRLEHYETRDEKVAPLVDALNKIGVRTLDSCEGHWVSPDNKYDYHYVRVDFIPADVPKVMPFLNADWILQDSPLGEGTFRLRSAQDAKDEIELKVLQDKALELAQRISNSISE